MEGSEEHNPSRVDSGTLPELRELAARVSELEVQVAALCLVANRGGPLVEGQHIQRVPAVQSIPPPPPPPSSAVPSISIHQESSSPGVRASRAEKSLEDRLGSQVFNLIGMVALIFGAAWALKLAIEHGLVTPTARVILGLLCGSGAIVGSEIFRRRKMEAFSYSLKAVGTAVLYLSLWAAFQLYGILSAPVALGGMILVTAWNVFMALTQDAELLAGYALLGGLLTPMLLSTGGDHETFLFTYIAAIDLGVVVLVRSKPWSRLLLPAFAATVAYFVGYYSEFFHLYVYGKRAYGWDTQSTQTAVFALVFFAIFAAASMSFRTRGEDADTRAPGVIASVLIPLGNAAFVALALNFVLQDSGLHGWLAWLMVALAAVFLGLMRLQQTSLAAAMQLAAAIVCLTVAVPLKASGHTLTTAWLVEGIILFWAATRVKTEAEAAARVLGLLALAGYMLGLGSVLGHWTWSWAFDTQPVFFSANLGSAMVAVCALAGAVWLSLPGGEEKTAKARVAVAIGALSAIDLLGLLLSARELGAGWTEPSSHQAFANPDFATSVIGLALFAATSWCAWQLSTRRAAGREQGTFRMVASIDSVLFNLIAILVVECEIGSLWPRQDAGLQRSLAISAFLMLYGAALLAVGFWRRSAFVRWQALILILFTIAKVFLYDISGLSAGYRVASFLALGALLMTVSFAYQKDWLGLKTPVRVAEEGS